MERLKEDCLSLNSLLDLLQEEKVKLAIRDIVRLEESFTVSEDKAMLKSLKEKYKKLKRCLSEEKEKTDAIELSHDDTLKTVNLNHQQAKEQMEQELAKLSEKNTYLNDEFSAILTAYKQYHFLSSERKVALKGIFKEDRLNAFWACGLQEKNIIGLWDYIRSEIIEGNTEELEVLVFIFEFFFENYLLAYPIYEKQAIAENEVFSPEKHIRHPDSSLPNGKIKRVELQGWQNVKTGKVIKQSVVML